MTIAEAADTLGISHSGLWRWLKRHNGFTGTRWQGRHRVLSTRVLERYERGTQRVNVRRAQNRPHGWVGIYAACDLAGGVNPTVVWRAVKRGDVKAVRVGHINYYDPDDLKLLRLSVKNLPLPGWQQVNTVVDAHGADRVTAIKWLKRHGFEIRKYRRPQDRQIAWYATHDALSAWQDYYLAYNPRKLTFQQAQDIRRRYADGERICHLSREYGIDPYAIRQILKGQTYKAPRREDQA